MDEEGRKKEGHGKKELKIEGQTAERNSAIFQHSTIHTRIEP